MSGSNSSEIIRVKRLPSNFVQIHKGFLEDPNLFYKAKGILAYLLTKPDGWIARVTDMMKRGKDGRDAIYNGLRELQEHGYYHKCQVRDGKGRITHWESTICEVPIWSNPPKQVPAIHPDADNQGVDGSLVNITIPPLTGYPYLENPYTINPHTVNQYHIIIM